MGDGRLTAVADTGPLIHLAEIGCLPLLAIFDEFHVPEGVWQEAQRPASIHSELGRADRHALPRAEVEEFAAKKGLQKLHGAERESLLLCSKLGVEVLITDDLAVRQAAKALGLTPIGSLGVIIGPPHGPDHPRGGRVPSPAVGRSQQLVRHSGDRGSCDRPPSGRLIRSGEAAPRPSKLSCTG